MNKPAHTARHPIPRDKRHWPLTITTGILWILVTVGLIAVWRYVGHDTYIVLTIILPALGLDIVLFFATLNGRKAVFKDMYESLLNLVYFWP